MIEPNGRKLPREAKAESLDWALARYDRVAQGDFTLAELGIESPDEMRGEDSFDD